MKNALRQGTGFLVSGTLAFATDATILVALTHGAGFDPFTARIIAICCAMIVGFFAHRRITFAVSTPATAAEFFKFLGVAASASALSFSIYSGILLLRPVTEPFVALVAATAVAMVYSYIGYSFGVFRKPPA